MELKAAIEITVQSIYEKYGEVRPSVLVESARPVDSVAHGAFEWDDQKAGEEFRLMQARNWIKRVTIIINDAPECLVHVPKIMNKDDLDRSREGYYKPIVRLSKGEYALALSQVLREVRAAQSSLDMLKSLAPKHIEKKIKKVGDGLRRVKDALDMLDSPAP